MGPHQPQAALAFTAADEYHELAEFEPKWEQRKSGNTAIVAFQPPTQMCLYTLTVSDARKEEATA